MTNKPLESGAQSATSQGREFWRSLEELAETAAFQDWLGREFPQGAAEMRDPTSRRKFLKLMGASLALASLTGCQFAIKAPARQIVPYVRQPELVVPGKALFYATAIVQHGYALGLLAESHEGRPTKVEGNPDHPSSLGSTDSFAQASMLQMYDPDRSQKVLQANQESTWQAFVAAALAALEGEKASQGAGVRILTETITSPTLSLDLRKLLRSFPQAKWYQYEPLARDGATGGARLAFGQDVHPVYDFTKADVILSLDADFTATGVGAVRYARDFSAKRKVRQEKKDTNRLYVVEPTPTPTGTLADHHLAVRASLVESVARAVAQALGIPGVAAGTPLSTAESAWAAAVAKDLQAAKGKSIVLAGDGQPAVVHALCHAINQTLGNNGTTVSYVEPVEAQPGLQFESIVTLANEMRAGQVKVLLMLGGNPVYNAPADVDFAGALAQVPLSIHQSLYVDETSSASTWHINATHYLEEWGDARGHDGTGSITQPLIAPIYDGKSASDIINTLLGTDALAGYSVLANYWRGQGVSEKDWFQVLHDGAVKGSAAKPVSVNVSTDFAAQPAAVAISDLEIVFRPDPTIGDGFYANNGWLQELPKPVSKLTWENAAYISPATAKELGLVQGDQVSLTVGGRSVTAPVVVVPGQADKTITAHLGYGRTKAGRVAVAGGGGFNSYSLRTAAAPHFVGGLQVAKVGTKYKLAVTQMHFQLEGRKKDITPSGTYAEYLENEEFLKEGHGEEKILSLFPEYEYKSYAWGLSIDLNVCTGCNACVIACQSENNIGLVGKDEVYMGRELQWMRIDQYFVGDENAPDVYNQPMLCQHCENAPCELVCPVAATSHDSEGLNVMTYNRCVGTKYCSNNCPYKVRRFNFLNYQDVPYRSPIDATTEYDSARIPVLKLRQNPDVTVRSRGVMEKCTYCVQRINEARIDAEKADRRIQDGEIVTACQQACPTQAIIFGDINDPNSQVTKAKADSLTFTVLGELNVKPRTSYMARLRNLNPELGGGEKKTE